MSDRVAVTAFKFVDFFVFLDAAHVFVVIEEVTEVASLWKKIKMSEFAVFLELAVVAKLALNSSVILHDKIGLLDFELIDGENV